MPAEDDRDDLIAPPLPAIAHATLDIGTEESLHAHPEHDRTTLLATVALGGVMVVAAIVVLVDAAGLRPSTAAMGPAVAPTIVGAALGAVGLVLAARAWWELRRTTPRNDLPLRARFVRLAAMVALLIAFAVLLPLLGYVVTSALLFTGAALLLGAPNPIRTLACGWTLAGLVFLVFDGLIGLALPV
jgi:putative tricarboxylic transport membrane protein